MPKATKSKTKKKQPARKPLKPAPKRVLFLLHRGCRADFLMKLLFSEKLDSLRMKRGSFALKEGFGKPRGSTALFHVVDTPIKLDLTKLKGSGTKVVSLLSDRVIALQPEREKFEQSLVMAGLSTFSIRLEDFLFKPDLVLDGLFKFLDLDLDSKYMNAVLEEELDLVRKSEEAAKQAQK